MPDPDPAVTALLGGFSLQPPTVPAPQKAALGIISADPPRLQAEERQLQGIIACFAGWTADQKNALMNVSPRAVGAVVPADATAAGPRGD